METCRTFPLGFRTASSPWPFWNWISLEPDEPKGPQPPFFTLKSRLEGQDRTVRTRTLHQEWTLRLLSCQQTTTCLTPPCSHAQLKQKLPTKNPAPDQHRPNSLARITAPPTKLQTDAVELSAVFPWKLETCKQTDKQADRQVSY